KSKTKFVPAMPIRRKLMPMLLCHLCDDRLTSTPALSPLPRLPAPAHFLSMGFPPQSLTPAPICDFRYRLFCPYEFWEMIKIIKTAVYLIRFISQVFFYESKRLQLHYHGLVQATC